MLNKNNVKPSLHVNRVYLSLKSLFRKVKQALYIFSIAFMLGFSNAMNDEKRMVSEYKPKIEQQDIIPDPDE